MAGIFNKLHVTQGRIKISTGAYVITSGGSKHSDTRVSSWTNPIDNIFTVTFPDLAQATTFFAEGGQIRISATRVGGTSNIQNDSMTSLLDSMETIIFDESNTLSSSGVGTSTSLGFENLTGVYQEVFSANSATAQYTADEFKIEAGLVGAALLFRTTITDDSDNAIDEAVDGTLTLFVDERRHTQLASPVYAFTNIFEG